MNIYALTSSSGLRPRLVRLDNLSVPLRKYLLYVSRKGEVIDTSEMREGYGTRPDGIHSWGEVAKQIETAIENGANLVGYIPGEGRIVMIAGPTRPLEPFEAYEADNDSESIPVTSVRTCDESDPRMEKFLREGYRPIGASTSRCSTSSTISVLWHLVRRK